MNKTELIKHLSKQTSLPQSDCQKVTNAFMQALTEELANGNQLMLQGFGTFSPWEQSERLGRNPRNGTACVIRPRTSVKFHPGKGLLESLNSK